MSRRNVVAAIVACLALTTGGLGLAARSQTVRPDQPPSDRPPPPPPSSRTPDRPARPTDPPAETKATEPADAPTSRDDDPAAGSGADAKAKAEADLGLRSRGLRRDGLVYVLDAEVQVVQAQGVLDLMVNQMQAAMARMNQLVAQAGQVELALEGARRELENAYAAAQFASNQALLEIQAANNMPATTTGSSTGGTTTTKGTTTPPTTTTTTPGQTTGGLNPARQLALIQENEMRRQRIAYMETQVYQLQSQRLQMGMEYDRLGTALMFKQAELDRGSLTLAAMVDQIARRYDDLGSDPAVKDALKTLNAGARKPVALGPRSDYKANVRKMAAELLESRQFVVEKGGKSIQLRASKDEATLAYLARRFVDDLRKAQQRLADNARAARSHETRLASLAAREQRLAADLAAASASATARGPIEAELAGVRKERDRYRKDLAANVEARKGLARDLAEKREGFVQIVDALEKAGAVRAADEEATRGDGEVQAAIQKFKPGRKPGRSGAGSAAAGSKPSPAEVYARALRRAEVPLSRDKVALWVNAAVNGRAGRRLVVDPMIEAVHVSERFAAEVGADVPADAPGASVTLADGRTIKARRATLKSVEVGTLAAADVEALVLLDGYDGPPRLGASFFDRFVTRIEPDAARLTLTQVDLRALPAASAPRGRNAPMSSAPAGRPASR